MFSLQELACGLNINCRYAGTFISFIILHFKEMKHIEMPEAALKIRFVIFKN